MSLSFYPGEIRAYLTDRFSRFVTLFARYVIRRLLRFVLFRVCVYRLWDLNLRDWGVFVLDVGVVFNYKQL